MVTAAASPSLCAAAVQPESQRADSFSSNGRSRRGGLLPSRRVQIAASTSPITASLSRHDQLMSKAEELEATFLSEMLAHSGLGEMQGSFSGGDGEAQFFSFLRQEQAKLIVQLVAVGASGGQATLTFADGGPGFAEDVLSHAFEPYVTTKAKGTGLGLAIVKKIIEEHGGRVVLANSPDGGARVSLVFPFNATGLRPAAAAA